MAFNHTFGKCLRAKNVNNCSPDLHVCTLFSEAGPKIALKYPGMLLPAHCALLPAWLKLLDPWHSFPDLTHSLISHPL
eukprot:1159762-Pelagomonas_calceolata.AAC.9